MTRRIRAALVLALLPAVALAQDQLDITPDQFSVMMNGPRFFAALVGGVLIAFAFQMLLTQFTMASGVSAVGDLHKLGRGDDRGDRGRATHERSRAAAGTQDLSHGRTHDTTHTTRVHDTTGVHDTTHGGHERSQMADTLTDAGHKAGDVARKAITGAGVWALLTSSVALFFASWLAVELSLTLDLVVGAVIGLAIWAFFYLAVVIWEAAALSSLAGSIAQLAMQGARSVFGGMSSIFSRSEERRAVDTAREVAHVVRDELTRDLDTAAVRRKLDQYVRDMRPPQVDPGQVKREVLDLLRNIQLDVDREPAGEGKSPGPMGIPSGGFSEEHLVARIEARGFSRDDAKRMAGGMRDAMHTARREWGEKDHTSAVADTAAQMAGLSREEAEAFRRRVEETLRNTGRSELEPEALKRDIERLFEDPRGGLARLRDRLKMMDRSTLVSLIASTRQDLDEERANHMIERVEEVVGRFRRQAERMQARTTGDGQPSFREPMVAHAERDRVWTETLDSYVERYERPQMSESAMKREIRMLLEDPQAEASALVARLRSLDREDLRHLVGQIPWLEESDADKMLAWVEETRDDIVHRVERVQRQAQDRAAEARQLAVDEAEEVRKTTATAAWWAFTSAAVSGGAAAAGGIVAVLLTL